MELGAIVGQDKAWCGGQDLAECFEHEGGLLAGWGFGSEGDGQSAVGVNEGEQIAAEAVADTDYGIAGEDGERGMFLSFGLTIFALFSDGFGSSLWGKSDGSMAHLSGVFGDDSPDGGDAGLGDGVLWTPVGQ